MDLLDSNLRALNDWALEALIRKVKPNENFEIFIGSHNADINFLNTKENRFLFNASGLDFTTNKINEFNKFYLYPYLYFFGFGNGIFYKLLLNNENLKRIIIIEPSIEIIFNVFNLVDFEKELKEKRLIIFHSANVNYENLSPIFYLNKNSLIFSKLYDLHVFNNYYDAYKDEIVRINRLFCDVIEHGVVSVGNDSKDAIIGIKHHVQNIPLMLKTPTLLNLVQNAKNTNTAVIVSTGPSLFKQLEFLKEMQNYISIFCVDASFPILSKHGIKPDIVITLERVEESAKFYEEVDAKYFKNVIFAITSIAHKKVFDLIKIKGGILQISQRPFGYTSYFELNDYGYIGIGMSAANMAYELIVHCNFSTCILIGQDLAFSPSGKSHSKGAVYGEGEVKRDENIIFLEKYGGGGVVESTKIWKMFLNFFIKDINETKNRIKVINATEGGARISGCIEMPFKEALKNIEKKKKRKIKLQSPINFEENYKKSKMKVLEYLSYGEKTKEKIEELFLKALEQTQILEKLNKENKLDNFDWDELEIVFDEIQDVKDLFCDKKFLNMFNEAAQSFIFHQEMEIAKVVTRNANSKLETQIKKAELLFLHKDWLFYLAGCMDSVLFCIKESFDSWE